MVYEFKFPDVGEGITEGKLIKWLVKVGDTVKVDQSIVEIETDKAVVEIPIPINGVVDKLLYKEQDTVYVGKPLIDINQDESVAEPKEKKSEGVNALPAVRKYAKDNKIDLSSVKGSGPDGRVLMKDLSIPEKSKSLTKNILASPSTRKMARRLKVNIGDVDGTGNIGIVTKQDVIRASRSTPLPKTIIHKKKLEAIVPMSSVRETIARRMLESKHNTAAVTIFDEANVSELVYIREKEKEHYKKEGIKLTYLAFFVKAAVLALRQHPYLNSTLDEDKKQIIIKEYFNINIAVDTDKGLFVPVVNNAENQSIIHIAEKISDLSNKAREGKLRLQDMEDGTFTITSVGNIGGQGFTPIINYPQAAILGVGRIVKKPVVKNNRIIQSSVVTLSLSFDHRILDGAEAARFLQTIIGYLEDPDSLFMELE